MKMSLFGLGRVPGSVAATAGQAWHRRSHNGSLAALRISGEQGIDIGYTVIQAPIALHELVGARRLDKVIVLHRSGHVGHRVQFRIRQPDGRDFIRRNDIVREWVAHAGGIDRIRVIDGFDSRDVSREIAGGFVVNRHGRFVHHGRMLVGKLPVGKEEQLVLNDRKSNRPARLVVLRGERLGGGEKALRVQIGVLVEHKRRART